MQKRIFSLINIAKRPTSIYIAINIFVSLIGFVRSFIFMRWLNMEELGWISLAQTVMQFISFFQVGLINGGYRIFSLDKEEEQRNVNNTLFSFFAMILGAFLSVWVIIVLLGKHVIMDNDLLLVSIICGMMMLINNWLNNTLIGKRKLSQINAYNIASGLISLSCLIMVVYIGFWGAVLSVVIQPICFVILSLSFNSDLRPTAFNFDIKLVKYILSFGFIPFLAGIFTMLDLQVERWSIAGTLGSEALGCFYLVFLFNSLYLLVPNSIMNIFYPQAVRYYDKGQTADLLNVVKKQSVAMVGYNVLIIIITFLMLDPIIKIIFPNHIHNTIYVYYLLPGLAAFAFKDVTGLVLNSCVRLKPILYGGIIASLANLIIVIFFIKTQTMSLTKMAVLKSFILIIPFVVQLLYILLNWNSIKKGYANKGNH